MNDKKPPLGMIELNNLGNNTYFLVDIKYEMFPKKKTKAYKKNNHLVIWRSSIDPSDGEEYVNQGEFPLMALPWFIDTIENKFWNHTPDPNALPGDVSESTVIEGEKIGINPMRHCCAENLFGYNFWNVSRRSYISRRAHHDWQIPRYMLEEGLLDQLKKISTDLDLKNYL